jgi:hypothetical protein
MKKPRNTNLGKHKDKKYRLLRILNAGGGFFMCRKNQILGFSLLTFGVGQLLSLLIPGAFLRLLLAAAAIAVGIVILSR